MRRGTQAAAPTVVIAALLIAALSASGQGQPDKPAVAPSLPGATKPGGEAKYLHVLVRVDSAQKDPPSQGEIEDTLKTGARKAECTYDVVETQVVPESFFRTLSLLSGTNPEPVTRTDDSGFTVQELSISPPTWGITLPSVDQVLTKLVLKLEGGKELALEPANLRVNKDAKLSLHTPGTYMLRLGPDEKPVKYKPTVHATGDKDPKKDVAEKDWPKQNRYLAITFQNFRGRKEVLLDMIKRQPAGKEQHVPNPFDYVLTGPERTFTMAYLGGQPPLAEEEFVGNVWTPYFPAVSGLTTKRVWMRFPLKEDEFKKEADEIRALRQPYTELPKYIDGKSPVRATGDAAPLPIAADTGARWIELTAVGGRFQRSMELKDAAQLLEKYPKAYRIVVYEYDDGVERRAQGLADPTTGGRTFWLGGEYDKWAKGVKKAAEKKP